MQVVVGAMRGFQLSVGILRPQSESVVTLVELFAFGGQGRREIHVVPHNCSALTSSQQPGRPAAYPYPYRARARPARFKSSGPLFEAAGPRRPATARLAGVAAP